MACIIRNPKSGLVLDASEYEVKLQHYTGFPSQLWLIQPAGQGKNFLINSGNGKVMDIQGGIKEGANIITFEKKGSTNQQWFINSDGSIVSSTGNLAIDICGEKYEPGTKIIAYPKHGKANQLFNFQCQ